MKEMDKVLSNDAHFSKREEDERFIRYYFDNDGSIIGMDFDKIANSKRSFPIEFFDTCGPDWYLPSWFLVLYANANDAYFKYARIRNILSGVRRPLTNILVCFCFTNEFGKEFYDNITRQRYQYESLRIPLEFGDILNDFRAVIEKERYVFKITKQDDNFIHVSIN